MLRTESMAGGKENEKQRRQRSKNFYIHSADYNTVPAVAGRAARRAVRSDLMK